MPNKKIEACIKHHNCRTKIWTKLKFILWRSEISGYNLQLWYLITIFIYFYYGTLLWYITEYLWKMNSRNIRILLVLQDFLCICHKNVYICLHMLNINVTKSSSNFALFVFPAFSDYRTVSCAFIYPYKSAILNEAAMRTKRENYTNAIIDTIE